MSEKKSSDTETILMALDQIGQTIDVMTSVVARLRNYVEHQDGASKETKQDSANDLRADRIIH